MKAFQCMLSAMSCALVAATTFDVQNSHAVLSQQMKGAIHRKVHQAFPTMIAGEHLRKRTLSYSTTGFVYANMAFDPSCHAPIANVGVPVDYCQRGEGYGYKVQIADGVDSCEGAIIQYFADMECTELLGTSALTEANLSCDRSSDVLGRDHGYIEFSCTNYATPKLSFASAVTEEYAGSANCSAERYAGYFAYSTGVCLQAEDFSWKAVCSDAGDVSWPVYFNNMQCRGAPNVHVDFPQTCQTVAPYGPPGDEGPIVGGGEEGDHDDRHILHPPPFPAANNTDETPHNMSVPLRNISNSVVSYCALANAPSAQPTAVPTFRPSAAPTARPSTAYPTGATESTVTFAAQQTISGLTEAAFNADVELYTLTIKQSIAATMQDVPVGAITDLVVTASAARIAPAAVLDALVPRAHYSRALATDSVDITYTVTVTTQLSVDALMAQLTAAVEGGTFDALLHEQAQTNGATVLVSASSNSVTTASTDDDDDAAPALATGAIVGIAAGGAVVLLMIAVSVYFICTHHKSSTVVAA